MRGEKTATAQPLHEDWTPNNANRAVAAEVGLDADTAAEAFRAEMAGENRRCWGSTFTEWLRAGWAGRDDAVADAAVNAALQTIQAAEDAYVSPYAAELAEVSAAVDGGLTAAERATAANWMCWDGYTVDDAATAILAARAAAPAPAVPVRVGFSASVVDSLAWLEQRIGTLTSAERQRAGQMLTDGVIRSEVWTTVQDARDTAETVAA